MDYDLEAKGHDEGYGQTVEGLLAASREIEKTARQLRQAEKAGDRISQITFERRLLNLMHVPDPGVF